MHSIMIAVWEGYLDLDWFILPNDNLTKRPSGQTWHRRKSTDEAVAGDHCCPCRTESCECGLGYTMSVGIHQPRKGDSYREGN